MPELAHPVPRDPARDPERGPARDPGCELAAALRRLVLDHCRAERRHVFAPVVHVGRPGALASHGVRTTDVLDHALRADVIGALLRRVLATGADADHREAPPLVWLTRPGELTLHDVDAAWLAAARTAYAELGVPLTMVVVTRRGWWDPCTGTRRTWKRLRQR